MDRASDRLSRRRFLHLMSGAAASAALAACGRAPAAGESPTAASGASAPATAGGRPVTLEFWFGEPPENGPQALADAFMARHPEIKVNATRYVNDDTGNTKLDTALQGGAPIDVFMSYGIPRLGQRITAGAALDLSPLIAADPAISAWVAENPNLFAYQGKHFSLPTVSEPAGVLINQDLLAAAGMSVPERWTIEEFRDMAGQLSADGVYGAYMPPDIARMTLGSNYWYAPDGSSSNFAHPAFHQWMTLWREMVDEGSAFPWTEVLAQNLRTYQQNVFLTGQVALWPASQFNLRYVNDLEKYPHDFKTSFAPLPTLPGVEPQYNTGGLANDVLISARSAHPDAAWEFLKFRLTEGAHYMLKSSKAPAFPGTDPAVIEDGILGPNKDTLYDVAAYRRAYLAPGLRLISDTVITGSAEILKVVEQQQDRCLIGETSVEECLATIKREADAAIARSGA